MVQGPRTLALRASQTRLYRDRQPDEYPLTLSLRTERESRQETERRNKQRRERESERESLRETFRVYFQNAPVCASFTKEGGPTYCGTQGSTSSIDHFLIPKEAKRQLGKVSVLGTGASDAAGAVSKGAGPHANSDGAPPHRRSQRWSKDRDNCALQTVKGRVEFLEIYKTQCREREKGNI